MDQDLADLVAAWVGDEVGDDRKDSVLARLRDDPEFRRAVVLELHMLGMLKVLRNSGPRWLRLEDELGWSAAQPLTATELADAVAAEVERLEPEPPATAEPSELPKRERDRGAPFELKWVLTLGLLVAVSAAFAWFASRPRLPEEPPVPVGVLVQLRGPGWGGGGPEEGAVVRTGSYELAGGTATLSLFNGVTMHVEGPAEIDFPAPDRVFCRKGKVRIDAPGDGGRFAVLAPGLSLTDPAAEFALTAAEGESSVMVFSGQAEVALVDRNGQAARAETVTAGSAVRIDLGAGQSSPTAADPAAFAGPIPTLDPPLALSREYPEVVKLSRPVAYWRFESAEKGVVANEIPRGAPLRLVGQPTLAETSKGNSSLSLSPPTEWDHHGAMSNAVWKPAGQEYAVECWAMPRQVRHAALVGLVADDGKSRELRNYGILLELTGYHTPYRLPDRSARALHRFPVGQVRGVNLFTPANYLPYRWQHLVAQRSGTRFELYVNGEIAAVAPVPVDVPVPGCRVLLGALYAHRDGPSISGRPFVGLLDEVALYGRPLTPTEIKEHHRLGSPPYAPE